MYQSLFAANQSQVVLADDFPYTALSTGIRFLTQFRAILSKAKGEFAYLQDYSNILLALDVGGPFH